MKHYTVEIDSEVYELLQSRAVPLTDSANDVLRRLLLPGVSEAASGGDSEAPTSPKPTERKPGDLLDLIRAGLLRSGDRLVHRQTRKGGVFWATVTSDGYIRSAAGVDESAPSPALKKYVGHEINGWDHWTLERTNETLSALREHVRSSSGSQAAHAGKYFSLWSWLRGQPNGPVSITFSALEAEIGMPLPESCRNHAAHWSSYDGSAVARAIIDAGWRASKVDLRKQQVTFVRS